jgi:broad specificity phosphatase PhoE
VATHIDLTSNALGERTERETATRIHLVRHGTTLLNRQNRYRGRRDVPLDQGGWLDAWSAASALEHEGVTAIYTSPLRRARDTARIVGDVTGIVEVTDLPGLVNVDYGDWEGLTSDEALAHDPAAFARYQACAPDACCPNGEWLDVASRRVTLALQSLAALHPGGNVAAVSHAAMVRLAIVAAGAAAPDQWRTTLPNGSITVFDVLGDDIEVVRVPGTAGVAAPAGSG